jgi:heat shock protein HslJ
MRILFALALLNAPAIAQVSDSQPKTFEDARFQEDLKRRFPQDIRLTVKALNGQSVNQEDKPVITFQKAGQLMQGFGGCNTVSADFRLTPRQIRFGPVSFTTKPCSEDTKKTEIAIFKAIQFATHWTPEGHNSFTFHGKAGKITFGPAF